MRAAFAHNFLVIELQWGRRGLRRDFSLHHVTGTIQPIVGDGGDRGGFVNMISRSNRGTVLSLQLARERAWQPEGGSNGHAVKRLGLSVWNSETTQLERQSVSNQRLLERLEAENAQLRDSVVDLVLQIQALRDGARTLTA